MRSKYVFDAAVNVANRYQFVNVVAKAARALHRPGTRIQDTMNNVLVWYSRANFAPDAPTDHGPMPIARQRKKPKALTETVPERNRKSGGQSAEASRPADRAPSECVSPVNPPGGNHIAIAGPILPEQNTWRLQ